MRDRRLNWTSAGKALPVDGGAPEGVRSLTAAEIGVVFQPIVDLATGHTFAQEALVRCQRAEYVAPPVLFEHAVRENGCGRLGRLIREVAFGTCGEVALFVNLHPEELSGRWLVRPDDPIGFHSHPVFLEITESAAFTHFDICLEVLKELSLRTGARLVVDDFGAGHSNLQRILDLQPAVVKLDLALTRDVHLHPRKQAVMRHMVALCKELGASVVAEGIEVKDELSCVRDLGVQYGQGYLLARPAAPPPPGNWPFRTKAPPPLPAARQRPPPLPPARAGTAAMPRKSKAPPRGSKAPPRKSQPPRGSKAPPATSTAKVAPSQKPTARPPR